MSFLERTAKVNGITLHYLDWGPADAPPVLLLHGITGHAEAYVRNLAAHAEHFSVWAIDFIGHGYSTKPDHPLEIKHYVEQVTAVLDTLGAQKAHFSDGGLFDLIYQPAP